jgi:hypothetical protein
VRKLLKVKAPANNDSEKIQKRSFIFQKVSKSHSKPEGRLMTNNRFTSREKTENQKVVL